MGVFGASIFCRTGVFWGQVVHRWHTTNQTHIAPMHSARCCGSGLARDSHELVGSAAQPGEQESGDPFTQYEQEQEGPINYRQRTLMNVIALAIVALLVGAGVWIADTIEVLQKDEDCVLQGRANCAPIEIPSSEAAIENLRRADRD